MNRHSAVASAADHDLLRALNEVRVAAVRGLPFRETRGTRHSWYETMRIGPDAIKSANDRAQAAFLIGMLAEDRPDDLREAHADALSRGPHWRDHIGRSRARVPDTAQALATA